MFHVTRCPNCRTSFRVTDAHLSAFDGKVRCGRCAFVFDAREHFIGESASKPPKPVPATPSPTPASAATPASAPAMQGQAATAQEEDGYGIDSISQQLGAAAAAEHDEADSLTSQSLQHLADVLAKADSARSKPAMLELDLDTDGAAGADPAVVDAASTDPAGDYAQMIVDEIVIEAPPEPAEDLSPAAFESWAKQLALPPEPVVTAPVTPPVAEAAPQPVDDEPADYRPILTAEDEALLRVPSRPSPWRWLWSIPCLLALLALAGQLAYHYRSELAVQLPGMRPRLQRFCELAGCRLELPSRSEYLHTDWSELKFAPEHPSVIQVDATLRNQAGFDQALPLMELTLTDDVDRIVARKVFDARAYLAPLADGTPAPLPASLAAGGELHAFLQLDLGSLHSSGYSINWIYATRN